jgi:paraquat-inducible protein A
MSTRNIIALILVVASFALLYPGLTQPLITISATFSLLGRTMELFTETRSILSTIRSLHESGNDFVAGLILLFGVVVPLVKGLVLLSVLAVRNARSRLFGFVKAISKWAMNDVFVVAVYTAFLAGKANENLDARLEVGFYYFTAYCLTSLMALQIMKIEAPAHDAPEPAPARVQATS